MLKPLVTVYVTTYNREDLLLRAIDSVITQNYRPIEIIVVDDCSTDSTASILDEYSEKLTEVEGITFHYHIQSSNQGACAARNYAIKRAMGEFITGLDDDDEFLSNRLSYFVQNWNDKYSAICTTLEVDDGNDKISYLNKDLGEINLDKLLNRNSVGSQIFTKTKNLRDICGFDIAFPAWQDYECWIRLIINKGCILKLGQANYRVHRSHDKPRITCDAKTIKAIELILIKHESILNTNQRKKMLFKQLLAKKQSFKSLRPWITVMTLKTAPRIFGNWLKYVFKS